ncbi:MAG TPA: hypothetical protein VER04_00185, partial [Polyangiaceae bacterium]|nr:hypothetical protein [Polyangiaceae bacterium]
MPRWLTFTFLLGAACGRTPQPPAEERPAHLISGAPKPAASSAPLGSPADLPGKKAGHGATGSAIKHVIVIAMENHDAHQIYDDPLNAPYIHALVESYAHAENFHDELPLEIPSEGH